MVLLHGGAFFGRTLKMPIGALGTPNFCDFTIRNGGPHPPVTHARKVHAKLREIQQASFESDLQWNFNIPLNRRGRYLEIEEFFVGRPVYLYQNNGKK